MKYLRMKNGIYEKKPLEKHLGKRKGKGYEIVFKEQDIINQADTVEELCDEFVCEGYISKPCLVELRRDNIGIDCLVKGTNDDWFIPESTVETLYGAIWTDKGLIYVAKMNEKGELELLWKV